MHFLSFVLILVKLALSAGYVMFSLIGDSKMSHYVVVGQPINDVKAAEKKAHPGEIILSPSAWHYLTPNEYVCEYVSDGNHTKVKGFGSNWRPIQRQTDKYQKQCKFVPSS